MYSSTLPFADLFPVLKFRFVNAYAIIFGKLAWFILVKVTNYVA